MIDALRHTLEQEPDLRYALLFGSQARGTAHAGSDVDVAIESARPLTHLELGDLIGRLESACGAQVDLVLLNEAPPALAYRIVDEGILIVVKDADALRQRRHRAILDYLDFRPMEQRFVQASLAAARGR